MSDENKIDYCSGIKKIPIILCPPEGARILLSEGRRLVCLVRHGQTDWNLELRLQGRESVPLNETGTLQAKECGVLFAEAEKRGLILSGVFSSPLSRSMITAENIANTVTSPVCATEEWALIERDYGTLSGLTMEERKIRFPKGEKQAENVESIPSAAKRLKKCIYELSEKSGGAVAAVTHGGILNAYFLKVTRNKVGTGKTLCENCHVSLVASGKGATIPLTYNLGGEMFLDYIEKLKLFDIDKK